MGIFVKKDRPHGGGDLAHCPERQPDRTVVHAARPVGGIGDVFIVNTLVDGYRHPCLGEMAQFGTDLVGGLLQDIQDRQSQGCVHAGVIGQVESRTVPPVHGTLDGSLLAGLLEQVDDFRPVGCQFQSLFPQLDGLLTVVGFIQDQAYFTRNFFTTGVLISHPALAEEGVFPPGLAELIYEAFMLLIPYDRQDIGWAADFLRQPRPPFAPEGQPFLAVFDQTYGSLRLSARLLEPGLLGRVLLEACMLAGEMEQLHLNAATRSALGRLTLEALTRPVQPLAFSQTEPIVPAGWEKVVMPESKGLLLRSNEEFRVVRLMQTPLGVCYEGVPASLSASAATTVMPMMNDVAEIPGESRMGLYDPNNGVLEAFPGGVISLAAVEGQIGAPAIYSTELAAERLAEHYELQRLVRIAARLGVDLAGESERSGLARRVASAVDLAELIAVLLSEE